MNKQDLLDELTIARADLLDAIAGLSPDLMLRPGAVGIWSVKDVLAHLAAWESETVTALNRATRNRPPSVVLIEDIDEWNQEQYHAAAARPLEAVLSDFEAVHKALLRTIRDFDENTLFNNRYYPWMEGEPLAYLIEENVYLHEREHAEDIRAWRQREGL